MRAHADPTCFGINVGLGSSGVRWQNSFSLPAFSRQPRQRQPELWSNSAGTLVTSPTAAVVSHLSLPPVNGSLTAHVRLGSSGGRLVPHPRSLSGSETG